MPRKSHIQTPDESATEASPIPEELTTPEPPLPSPPEAAFITTQAAADNWLSKAHLRLRKVFPSVQYAEGPSDPSQISFFLLLLRRSLAPGGTLYIPSSVQGDKSLTGMTRDNTVFADGVVALKEA